RTFSYVLRDGESEIKIYQTDVRAIQLAKAALYAGAKLLMDRLGLEKVDRIQLTGAFGSHIDTKYAMVLGMIPDCDLEEVHAVGNAAGIGARIALLNNSARDEIEELVKSVEKVETAVEPKFQQYFIEAMAIPHKTESYPNLSKAVKLPPPKVISDGGGEGGRRRRRRG
ncbi:MAG: ASKHA domain-containing protein, partial [Sneathiella sp.]